MTSTLTPPPLTDEGHPGAPPDLHPRRESAIYLVLVYASVLGLALALPGTKENPGPVSLLTLLVPATIVGLIRLTSRLRHGPANPFPLGLRKAGFRSWPAALLIPAGVMAVSLGATYGLGVIRFDDLGLYLLDSPINIVIMSFLVLGEELGWRSYLLPRLASVMPVRRASLVTGFCQGLFHMPLVLIAAGYDAEGARWIVAPGVILCLTAAGPLFGWLRVRSGSIWPAAIAHATVNTFIIEAPTLVADNPDQAAYLTGEAGLFTVLVVMAAAAFVWHRCNWTPRGTESSTETVLVGA